MCQYKYPVGTEGQSCLCTLPVRDASQHFGKSEETNTQQLLPLSSCWVLAVYSRSACLWSPAQLPANRPTTSEFKGGPASAEGEKGQNMSWYSKLLHLRMAERGQAIFVVFFFSFCYRLPTHYVLSEDSKLTRPALEPGSNSSQKGNSVCYFNPSSHVFEGKGHAIHVHPPQRNGAWKAQPGHGLKDWRAAYRRGFKAGSSTPSCTVSVAVFALGLQKLSIYNS